MPTYLASSGRYLAHEVTFPELRIYWPRAARRARSFPQIERILSVRLKAGNKLLGLIMQTHSACFAVTLNGERYERVRTIGAALDWLKQRSDA